MRPGSIHYFFFFNADATTKIYTLSLHDALPISRDASTPGHSIYRRTTASCGGALPVQKRLARCVRSEEHTSELQSPCNLVCRLLLEKKKKRLHNADGNIQRSVRGYPSPWRITIS